VNRSNKKLFVCTLPLAAFMAGCSDPPKVEVAKAPERPVSNYYVSPKGTPDGNGSMTAPWDLATALAHPAVVVPGDRIWLRGGTYKGQFNSRLNGSQVKPITVRNFESERVVLDFPGDAAEGAVLRVDGAWTWYWGFEVTSSAPVRIDPAVQRVSGVNVFGPNNKLINLVVHDVFSVGFWGGFDGSEMHGNLLYYNGQENKGQSLGHGLSSQNQEGTKLISDNMAFQNFGHGFYMFGSDKAYLNNFVLEGNVAFNNGSISKSGEERNILLGGAVKARKPVLNSNYTYWSKGNTLAQNNIGYLAGCDEFTAKNNYFAIGVALVVINCEKVVAEGNTFVGSTSGIDTKSHPANLYFAYGTKPNSSVNVFVRPNKYQPGRGHVIVFNWENRPAVDVDLKDVLKTGDNYEIRDVQNYFGAPVAQGVYQGGAVSIPVQLTAVAKPIGIVPVPPVHTAEEFGAFVVQAVAAPAPAAAPTQTKGGSKKASAPAPAPPVAATK
jgi:hypothetical protein